MGNQEEESRMTKSYMLKFGTYDEKTERWLHQNLFTVRANDMGFDGRTPHLEAILIEQSNQEPVMPSYLVSTLFYEPRYGLQPTRSYFWDRFLPKTLAVETSVLEWLVANRTYISPAHIHGELKRGTAIEDIMPNYETQKVWDIVKDWIFVDRPDLDFYFVTGYDGTGISTFRDECLENDPIATEYKHEKMIVNIGYFEPNHDMSGILTDYWRYFSDSDADNLITWGQFCVRWDCILRRIKELEGWSK